MTSPGTSSPSSRQSGKKSTEQTVCVTLSFDYDEWSHPLFVEGTICEPLQEGREKEQIKAMMEELEDQILDLFGVQVLPLLTDEGVWYGGAPGRRIIWYHRYPSDGREYTW